MEINLTPQTCPAYSAKTASSSLPSRSGKEVNSKQRTVQKDSYEHFTWGNFIEEDKMQTEGVFFDGKLPEAQTLEITESEAKDEIDWDFIEQKMNGNITIDNADRLIYHVNSMAGTYVAAKSHLEQVYTDREDILAEKMEKLNILFNRAKNQMVSSYQNTVGSFYEGLGNSGIRKDMGESLSSIIEHKIEELEDTAEKSGILERTPAPSFQHLQIFFDVKALEAEETRGFSGLSEEENQGKYSLNDLQAAGIIAKTASKMNPNELQLMSDEELGIHLAVRYMKVSELLSHLGVGEKMADMIQTSFETYLDRYSGKALSGQNKAFHVYHYALKQYESTGSIRQALTQSAKTYLGNSFFDTFIMNKDGGGAAKFTRYQLDLNQFAVALDRGSISEVITSIAGNRVYGLSAYA